MVQVKDLTQRTVVDLWKELKEHSWEEITQEQLRFVRRMIEARAGVELVTHLQATWYQRSPRRRGYRNGYRLRDLVTQWGHLEDLRVPRDREGAFQSRVVERYQRCQPQVAATVREIFLRGVSTRQVETVVEPLLGTGLSALTVSRITPCPRRRGLPFSSWAPGRCLSVRMPRRDHSEGEWCERGEEAVVALCLRHYSRWHPGS